MEEIRQSTVWTNQQYEPIQYIWEACSIDVFAIGPVFLLPPEPVPLPWKLRPVQVRPNQLTCESLSSVFLTHGRANHTISQYDLKIWISNQILPKTLIICIYMLYIYHPSKLFFPKKIKTSKSSKSKLHLWHQDPKILQFHQKWNPPRHSKGDKGAILMPIFHRFLNQQNTKLKWLKLLLISEGMV